MNEGLSVFGVMASFPYVTEMAKSLFREALFRWVLKMDKEGEMLDEWTQYRTQTVTRRTQHRLDNVQKRLHILEGRMIAFLSIDKIIKVIRESDDPDENLMRTFGLSTSPPRPVAAHAWSTCWTTPRDWSRPPPGAATRPSACGGKSVRPYAASPDRARSRRDGASPSWSWR